MIKFFFEWELNNILQVRYIQIFVFTNDLKLRKCYLIICNMLVLYFTGHVFDSPAVLSMKVVWDINIYSFHLRNEFLRFTVLARLFGLYPCLFPKLHSNKVLLLLVHWSMPVFCSLYAHLWPRQPNNWSCERTWIITEGWFLGPLAVCMENLNLSVTLQSSFCQAK